MYYSHYSTFWKRLDQNTYNLLEKVGPKLAPTLKVVYKCVRFKNCLQMRTLQIIVLFLAQPFLKRLFLKGCFINLQMLGERKFINMGNSAL